jgi:hypothetical protein
VNDSSFFRKLIYRIYYELKPASFKFLIQIILVLSQELVFILLNLIPVIDVSLLRIILKT